MTEREKLINAFIDKIGNTFDFYLDEYVDSTVDFIDNFITEYDNGKW